MLQCLLDRIKAETVSVFINILFLSPTDFCTEHPPYLYVRLFCSKTLSLPLCLFCCLCASFFLPAFFALFCFFSRACSPFSCCFSHSLISPVRSHIVVVERKSLNCEEENKRGLETTLFVCPQHTHTHQHTHTPSHAHRTHGTLVQY